MMHHYFHVCSLNLMPHFGRGCRISTLIMVPINFLPNSDLFKKISSLEIDKVRAFQWKSLKSNTSIFETFLELLWWFWVSDLMILGPFGSGQVWSPLVPYCPLWFHMVPYRLYGPLWSCMAPYDLVCSPMVLYGSLWFGMFPIGPLWSNKVPYGPVWSPLVLYGLVWSLMFRYGYVLPHMVLYGRVWSLMILYGPLWSCVWSLKF